VSSEPAIRPESDAQPELEALRARIAELEDELEERTAAANAAVAAAQDRIFWLDRFRIDLNSLMRRSGPRTAWTVVRVAAAFAAHLKGGLDSMRRLPARVREILAEERDSAQH
jgi:hypothetical protein